MRIEPEHQSQEVISDSISRRDFFRKGKDILKKNAEIALPIGVAGMIGALASKVVTRPGGEKHEEEKVVIPAMIFSGGLTGAAGAALMAIRASEKPQEKQEKEVLEQEAQPKISRRRAIKMGLGGLGLLVSGAALADSVRLYAQIGDVNPELAEKGFTPQKLQDARDTVVFNRINQEPEKIEKRERAKEFLDQASSARNQIYEERGLTDQRTFLELMEIFGGIGLGLLSRLGKE